MPYADYRKALAYQKVYRQRHKVALTKARQRRRLSSHQKYREAALVRLGDKCANPDCKWLNEDGTLGCKDRRALQIDHINGNGPSDRDRFSQTYTFYKHVAECENPFFEYQLLCANCNWIKRCINREYQHRKES